MTDIRAVRYDCLARFTLSAVNYAIATRDVRRAGVWHEGVLADDVPVERLFSDGIVRGGNAQLRIGLVPGLAVDYAALDSSALPGTDVTVECVCTITDAAGVDTEQVRTQVYTCEGVARSVGMIVLRLVDMDDKRLAQLIPERTFTADDWPELLTEEAGRAIPDPTGTALKLRAVLLHYDYPTLPDFPSGATGQWYFGLCEASLATHAIIALDNVFQQITVAGDQRAILSVGCVVFADWASNIPGRYTITAVALAGSDTLITVAEPLASAVVAGSLLIPPTVLTVYRNGVIVPPAEYTVEMMEPSAAAFADETADDNLDGTGASQRIGSGAGSGSATQVGGAYRLQGDGGITNYGLVGENTIVGAASVTRGAHYGVDVVASGTGRVLMYKIDSGAVVRAVARQRVLLRNAENFAHHQHRANFITAATNIATDLSISEFHAVTTGPRLLLLRFTREQVDFGGQRYTLEADVRGVRSRNVSDEIKRVIEATGATADAATFTAAQTYATTHRMLVDVPHGRDGSGRRARAVLEDLLFIARGSLHRDGAGAYAIVQDKPVAASTTLDESLGDYLEIRTVARHQPPTSLGIRYKPQGDDPGKMQHTLTRTVTGGSSGDETPRDVPYLRDHEAADRLVCYLALRAQHNRELDAQVPLLAVAIGNVLNLGHGGVGLASSDWQIREARQRPAVHDIKALEHVAAVYTYTAGTLPRDAQNEYAPDYSFTAPAAPTALAITAAAVSTATDGSAVARITATLTVPAVNWAEIWMAAVHNVTGEIELERAAVLGTAASAVIGGLRPGEVYQLLAYAVNANGVQGAVQNTFDATAIGGGATDTTFIAAGVTTLPANVASCTLQRSTGVVNQVSWPAVSTVNLREYVVERNEAGGGFVECWRGVATNFHDRAVTYGFSYQYRVKARDVWGNMSAAWATSSSIIANSTISGGVGNDINDNTVATNNRTSVSTLSQAYAAQPTATANGYNFTHSLGKVPLLTVDTGGGGDVLATLSNVDSTTARVVVVGVVNAAVARTKLENVIGANHDHELLGNSTSGTVYLRVW